MAQDSDPYQNPVRRFRNLLLVVGIIALVAVGLALHLAGILPPE